MLISLHGQDSYRISQKLKELVAGYRAKNPSGLNLVSLDFSEDSPDFKEALKAESLIPEKKLVILKNIEKADPGKILETVKSGDIEKRTDIIVIAVSFSDLDKSGIYENISKKPNQSQKFDILKGYEIKNWVLKFAGSLGVDFTSEALEFLISNGGPDLWRLDSEIRKIADYASQNGRIKVVSKFQVEELAVSNRNYNIFELTDALAKRNKFRALSALHKALDGGEKPTEILGLLAWQVRNLLKFKSTSDPAGLKLHPFVLEKTRESAKSFSIEELSGIFSKIIDLDLAFKTGDLNEKTALSLLISEI